MTGKCLLSLLRDGRFEEVQEPETCVGREFEEGSPERVGKRVSGPMKPLCRAFLLRIGMARSLLFEV